MIYFTEVLDAIASKLTRKEEYIFNAYEKQDQT